jgi:hypothetical protein
MVAESGTEQNAYSVSIAGARQVDTAATDALRKLEKARLAGRKRDEVLKLPKRGTPPACEKKHKVVLASISVPMFSGRDDWLR